MNDVAEEDLDEREGAHVRHGIAEKYQPNSADLQQFGLGARDAERDLRSVMTRRSRSSAVALICVP